MCPKCSPVLPAEALTPPHVPTLTALDGGPSSPHLNNSDLANQSSKLDFSQSQENIPTLNSNDNTNSTQSNISPMSPIPNDSLLVPKSSNIENLNSESTNDLLVPQYINVNSRPNNVPNCPNNIAPSLNRKSLPNSEANIPPCDDSLHKDSEDSLHKEREEDMAENSCDDILGDTDLDDGLGLVDSSCNILDECYSSFLHSEYLFIIFYYCQMQIYDIECNKMVVPKGFLSVTFITFL